MLSTTTSFRLILLSIFSGQGQSIASLGLTQNSTAEVSWGEGADQRFSMSISDTQAVPEPLTMLGASTAIAFGAAFKKRRRAK